MATSKDKPGKNMVIGETFHPITENAMVNNIVKNFSGDKKSASVNDLQDRHKEIKEKYFDKGVKPSEIEKLDKEFKSRLTKAKSRANKAISNRPGMEEYRKKQRSAKASDTGSEYKAGGKVLKPVDKSKNPGLSKLPTKVRNKMGYMKKGGRVMSKRGMGKAMRGGGCVR